MGDSYLSRVIYAMSVPYNTQTAVTAQLGADIIVASAHVRLTAVIILSDLRLDGHVSVVGSGVSDEFVTPFVRRISATFVHAFVPSRICRGVAGQGVHGSGPPPSRAKDDL